MPRLPHSASVLCMIIATMPLSPLIVSAQPVATAWDTNDDGLWSEALNWTNGEPANTGLDTFVVTLDRDAFGGDPTITLDMDRTIDELYSNETLSLAVDRNLTVTRDLLNTGTVRFNGLSVLTADRFTNDVTGTLEVVGATGTSNTLAAELFNHGILDIDRQLLINKSNASHVNTGTVDIKARERLSFDGSYYTFLNNGTINLGRRAQIAFDGGTFNLASGTFESEIESVIELTGGSSMAIYGGVFDHHGDIVMSSSSFNAGLASYTNEGLLSLTSSTYESFSGISNPVDSEIQLLSNSNIHAPISNYGHIQAAIGSNVISGQIDNVGTLRVGNNQNNTSLATSTIINSGTIQLDYNATLTADSLHNAPGASLQSVGGGTNYLSADVITNDGTFLVEQDLVLNRQDALFVNNQGGSIDLTAGDFTMSGYYNDFQNSGAINLSSGTRMTIDRASTLMQTSSGSFNGLQDSTLEMKGNSRFDVGQGMFNHTGNISLNQGVLDLGNQAYVNQQTITMIGYTSYGGSRAEIVSTNMLTNEGDIHLQREAELLAPVHNAGTITAVSYSNFINALDNNGTLVIGDFATTTALGVGALYNTGTVTMQRYSTLSGGDFINEGEFVAQGGSDNTLAMRLINTGVMDVDSLELNKPNVLHLNTGTINADGGTLKLNGVNTTFVNQGQFSLGYGQTLEVAGESVFTNEGGSFSGTNSSHIFVNGRYSLFAVTDGTFNFSGDVTVDDGTIDLGSRAYTNDTGKTITLDGESYYLTHAQFLSSGQLTNNGTLNLTGQGRVTAPILNSGDITVTESSNSIESAIINNGSFTIGDNRDPGGSYYPKLDVGNITNNGTLALNRLATLSGGEVTNNGMLLSTGGDNNTLNAELHNYGTVQVEEGLTLNRPSVSHTNSPGAYIDVADDTTLTLSGTDHSTVNSGSITLGNNATLVVSGTDARFVQADGTFDSSPDSTLEISGSSPRFTVLGGNFNHRGNLTVNGSYHSTPAVFDAGLTAYTNQGTLTLARGKYNSAGAILTNDGQLYMQANTSITAPFVNTAGAHANVVYTDNRFTDSVTNHGTLTVGDNKSTSNRLDINRVDNYGELQLHFSSTLAGTSVHNYPGGTLRSLGGPGNYLTAEFTNDGEIVVDESMIVNLSGAEHINNGAINVNDGVFSLTTGRIFDPGNTGSLNVAASGEASFSGSSTTADFSSIDNDGMVSVASWGTLTAGTFAGTGAIDVSAGTINVHDDLTLGSGAQIHIGTSSLLEVGGDFFFDIDNQYTFQWGSNATLRMTGGLAGSPVMLEIGGNDVGTLAPDGDPLGFENNFDLSTLELAPGAHVTLADLFDNYTGGSLSESLYVDTLIIGTDAILDSSGYNIYYRSLTGSLSAVINPGPLSTAVPEPITALLFAPVAACILYRRRFTTTHLVMLAMVVGMGLGATATFAQVAHEAEWLNDSDGFWNDPANWNIFNEPAPPDVPNNQPAEHVFTLVTIDRPAATPTISLDVDITINQLVNTETLDVFEGFDLTLEEAGLTDALTNSGTILLNGNGSTIKALTNNMLNSGVIEIRPGSSSIFSTVTGSLENMATGEINVGDPLLAQPTALTVTNPNLFVNDGTLRLQGSAALNAPAGTVVNTGLIESNAVTGADENVIESSLANEGPNGTVNVDHNLLLSQTTGSHTNSGTFTLNGGKLDFAGSNSSFTNTGDFIMLPGSEVNIPSSLSYNQDGGTLDCQAGADLTISGTLTINGGTFSSACDLNFAGGSLIFTSGALENYGHIVYGSAATINYPIDNYGIIDVLRDVTAIGVWDNMPPGTINIGNDTGYVTLTLNQNFASEGTVAVLGRATLRIPSGDFVNDGQFYSMGVNYPNYLEARLINHGNAQIMNSLTLSRSNVTHTNSGVLSVEASHLAFSGSSIQLNNTGTVQLTNGSYMAVPSAVTFNNNAGGTLQIAPGAELSLSGIINNSGGTFTQQGLLSVSGGSITQTQSTIANSGMLELAGSATIDSPIENTGHIAAWNSNQINSTVNSTGTVTVGNNSVSSYLTLGQNFNNQGHLQLNRNATVFVDTLTNASSGVIETIGGPYNTLTARLINNGILNVAQDLNMNKAGVTHANSDTINVSGCTLTTSGSGHTIANNGTFTLSDGGQWSMTSGTLQNNGSAVFAGTSGTSASLTASTITRSGGDIFDYSGDLSLSSTSTLSGDYVNHGMLSLSSSNLTGTLENMASATTVLSAPSGSSNVGSTLTNAGLLQSIGTNTISASVDAHDNSGEIVVGDNSSTSKLTVGGTLVNTGMISLNFNATYEGDLLKNEVGGTVRTINGPGDKVYAKLSNRGDLIVDHDLIVDRDLAQHANYSTGQVLIHGGDLTLAGADQNFDSSGTVALDAPYKLTISEGSFRNLGIFNGQTDSFLVINSSATLTLSGGVFNHMGNLAIEPGATLDAVGLDYTNNQLMTILGQCYYGQQPATFTSALDFRLINAGELQTQGPASISAIVQNEPDARISILSAYQHCPTTMSKTFYNDGMLVVGDNNSSSSYSATLDVNSELWNNGTIAINGRATLGGGDKLINNGVITTTGGLENRIECQLDITPTGQVVLGMPLTIDLPLTTHQNAGLIDATQADLTLAGNNHLFNNLDGGVVDFGSGRAHTMTGTGRFAQLGGVVTIGDDTALTLSGGYDIVLSGGEFHGTSDATLNLAGTGTSTLATLEVTTESFDYSGNINLGNYASFNIDSYTNQGTMTFAYSRFGGDVLINSSVLELNGTTSGSCYADIVTATALRNQATMRIKGLNNTVHNELRNTGIVTVGNNLDTTILNTNLITNEGTLQLRRNATINGSGSDLLSNNNGGLLEVIDGGSNVLNININNNTNARFVVNEDVTINHPSGNHINNGSITVNSGTLKMTTGSLSGNGVLTIKEQGAAEFTGASTQAEFSYIDNGGDLVINSADLSTSTYQGSGGVTADSSFNVDFDMILAGDESRLLVNDGYTVTVGGHFWFEMTDEFDFEWTEGAQLLMTGGSPGNYVCMEVGGHDLGTDAGNHVGAPDGFEDNFELATLRLAPGAHVALQDNIDNGNRTGVGGVDEALYVETLILEAGAELNVNGLHLYFNNLEGTVNQIVDTPVECNGGIVFASADLDRDGDVDLTDFSAFAACFNGPNRAPTGGCTTDADLDGDDDVDLTDFSTFAACFNGPNRPPAAGCP